MGHTRHAHRCTASCPPRWLMCEPCWASVSPATQAEVYRAVQLRRPEVDATWAPWWKARANAIAENALARGLRADIVERIRAWEYDFVKKLGGM